MRRGQDPDELYDRLGVVTFDARTEHTNPARVCCYGCDEWIERAERIYYARNGWTVLPVCRQCRDVYERYDLDAAI